MKRPVPGDRKRLGAVRAAAACALCAAALLLAGCIFDSDDGPIYGAVVFKFLRFPGVVAAGAESTAVETDFLIGTDGCWALQDLSLELVEDTIRISGVTKKGDPYGNCPTVVVTGEEEFFLPSLDPGLYWIEAFRLIDTLRVSASMPTGDYRLVMEGQTRRDEGGCGHLYSARYTVGLSSLPDSVPKDRVIVWADQVDEDPCERSVPRSYDYYASVRRIEAVPQ